MVPPQRLPRRHQKITIKRSPSKDHHDHHHNDFLAQPARMPVRHILCGRRGTPRAECRCGRSLSAGALAGALAPAANGRVAQAGRLRFFVRRRFLRDDQGVVRLELAIQILMIFIRKCDASSPPSDHDDRNSSDRKGRYSLRLLRRLISTDPALRRRQVVRFYLRRLPHLHLTTLLIWVRGDPAGCDKQSGHPPGLAARVGH